MKKILLVSFHVHHYRIKIYNYFFEEFKKSGIDFAVLANSIQDVSLKPKFNVYIEKPSYLKYIRFIGEYQPDYVITYLNLSDTRIYPVMYYCRIKKIPLIYWGHGINLLTPDNVIKNIIYHHLHRLADAIILYSEGELRYIKKKNHPKVFIANNTLDFSGIEPRDKKKDLDYIRAKYHIREEHLVLFVGRVTELKKLDVLLNLFRDKNIALVIVGPGIKPHHLDIIREVPNYYYLGEIYEDKEIQAVFNASKFFCIPGNIGLGLNQAFFWGIPVVTLEGLNTPEIIYLKDHVNGYIVRQPEEIEEKILTTLKDEKLYADFSVKAKETADTVAHISKMFQGFYDTIKFIDNTKVHEPGSAD